MEFAANDPPTNPEGVGPFVDRPRRNVRFSDVEWRHVVEQGKLAGRSPSGLLRDLACGLPIEAKPHLMTSRALAEVLRIGNNLQQLQRVAGEAGHGDILARLGAAWTVYVGWINNPPIQVTVGRPRGGEVRAEPGSAARSVRSVRMSDAEWRGVADLGHGTGLGIGTVLRELALQVDLEPAQAMVTRTALRRLVKLGRQLNGWAKRANEHREVVDPKPLDRTLTGLEAWWKETAREGGVE